MLDMFRRGVKTWVAKVLLAILILSFAVWGIGDIFLGGGYSSVATVGESKVSTERFASTVRREQIRMTMQRREAVSLAEFRAQGIDQQVLSAMLRDAAYREELDRLGIVVSRLDVANTIRSNPDFFNSDGRFDLGIYSQRIGQSGFRTEEFEEVTAGVLNRAILGEAVRVGQPPAGIAETIARWQGEQRGFTFVELSPAMAPEPTAPDDATLLAWFERDKEPFRVPERRWGSYVRLNPAEIARGITPSDAEIEADYQARIADYSVAPKRTIEQVVFEDKAAAEAAAKRIADGEASYEEIAAEQNVSVADLSLGEVGRGELGEASETAVFAVEEPGIVGPVETPFGFALFNVTAVVKEEVRPLEEVKSEVSNGIALRQAMAVVRDRSGQIDELRASGASMEELAKALETELVRFSGLAPDGTVAEGEVPALAADPRFTAEVQAALSGDERDVIQLTDGGYALVMVEKVEESHLPGLEEVKDRVLAAWTAEQRMEWLDARAEELIAAAEAGTLTPAEGRDEAPADPAKPAEEKPAEDQPTEDKASDGADASTTAGDTDEKADEAAAGEGTDGSATTDDTAEKTASEEKPAEATTEDKPAETDVTADAEPLSAIAAIAAEVGNDPIELPPVARDGMPPILNPEMAQEAFAAEEGGLLHGRARGNTAVIILSVREIVPLDGDALASRIEALEETMSQGIAADTAELFGRALETRYDVRVNRPAIDSVFEQLGQSGY